MTTVGIVFSMLFETINFFGQYDWRDFFFCHDWSPNFRGDSPIWVSSRFCGARFTSALSRCSFAVPVGLFAAIYLSEYASPRMRADRQAADRGAGRYPHHRLRPVRADHSGPAVARLFRGAHGAWVHSASSVMTAGLVMGVMLIPLCQLAVGRHHQCGPASDARRLARPWRHPVRDDPPGRAPRRLARHRRRHPAGRVAAPLARR